ncbi:hypothetical protein [Sphingomonas sp. Leaf357]|uniref:hypothetical protein n=1 Tax=Sphingomonas sp. Leaf357 TaxID=1736350 RepID=UPI000AE4DFF8|nr:hypothetical protein [Sphingomonas sp. Leaf357]
MNRSKPSHRHRLPLAIALVAGAIGWSGTASAQDMPAPTPSQAVPPPASDAIRLSDAERNAILDSNTVESAAVARGELGKSGLAKLGIHGEMGVMVGSNGTRGIYGVAEIPLGESASAVVSFESSRFGGYRRRSYTAP